VCWISKWNNGKETPNLKKFLNCPQKIGTTAWMLENECALEHIPNVLDEKDFVSDSKDTFLYQMFRKKVNPDLSSKIITYMPFMHIAEIRDQCEIIADYFQELNDFQFKSKDHNGLVEMLKDDFINDYW
jgi:hypothetical protein